MDIQRLIGKDQYDAAMNSSSPSAANPFATIADVPQGLPDTLAINNTTLDGQTIQALNGGGSLNLRDGTDGFVRLKTDLFGQFLKMDGDGISLNYGAFLTDNVSILDMSSQWGQIIYANAAFTRYGYMGLYNNDVDLDLIGFTDTYPAVVGSRDAILRANIVNSIVMGGNGIILKTNNTAYSNQFGFSKNREAFETILNYTTPTADRTATLQNASGTLAYLSDITAVSGLPNTLAIDNTTGANDISIDNGQKLIGTTSGSFIDLDDGINSAINLTSKKSVFWQGGEFGVTTRTSVGTFNDVGISLLLFKDDATRYGTLTIAGNDTNDVTEFDVPSYPITIASQHSVLKAGVVNSVALGGNDIIAKTNDTAYVNQVGFNAGLAGEMILAHTASASDFTATLQAKTGTIAYLSDISSTIYNGNGTVGTNRQVELTDFLTFTNTSAEPIFQMGHFGGNNFMSIGSNIPTLAVTIDAFVGTSDTSFNSGTGNGLKIQANTGSIQTYNNNLGSPTGTLNMQGSNDVWTMPNGKTGTVALLSDIGVAGVGGIYSGSGTMSAGITTVNFSSPFDTLVLSKTVGLGSIFQVTDGTDLSSMGATNMGVFNGTTFSGLTLDSTVDGINFQDGTAAGGNQVLKFNYPTVNFATETIELPVDVSGTVALTSDITVSAVAQTYVAPTNVNTTIGRATWDANSTSINQIADVVGTLIADLKTSGIIL